MRKPLRNIRSCVNVVKAKDFECYLGISSVRDLWLVLIIVIR